jgi:hypothetical protein
MSASRSGCRFVAVGVAPCRLTRRCLWQSLRYLVRNVSVSLGCSRGRSRRRATEIVFGDSCRPVSSQPWSRAASILCTAPGQSSFIEFHTCRDGRMLADTNPPDRGTLLYAGTLGRTWSTESGSSGYVSHRQNPEIGCGIGLSLSVKTTVVATVRTTSITGLTASSAVRSAFSCMVWHPRDGPG